MNTKQNCEYDGCMKRFATILAVSMVGVLCANHTARAELGLFIDEPVPLTPFLGQVGGFGAIAADDAGNVISVFDASGGIAFARSGDGGLTWSQMALLALNASDDEMLIDPEISTDGQGNWFVVCKAVNLGEPPARGTRPTVASRVVMTRSLDDGATWSLPAPIYGGALNNGIAAAPAVMSSETGSLIVMWTQLDQGVMFVRSENFGMTWTQPKLISTRGGAPMLATDGSGNWLAAWSAQDPVNTDLDIEYCRSASDGEFWSPAKTLNTTAAFDYELPPRPEPEDEPEPCDGCPPPQRGVPKAPRFADELSGLATDGAGTWVATWTLNYPDRPLDVFYARSVNNGATWSDPELLDNFAALEPAHRVDPKVAYDGLGGWVAVWSTQSTLGGLLSGDQDLVVARSMNGGLTWSDPGVLNLDAAEDEDFDTALDLTTDNQGNFFVLAIEHEFFGPGDSRSGLSAISFGIAEAGPAGDPNDVGDGGGSPSDSGGSSAGSGSNGSGINAGDVTVNIDTVNLTGDGACGAGVPAAAPIGVIGLMAMGLLGAGRRPIPGVGNRQLRRRHR